MSFHRDPIVACAGQVVATVVSIGGIWFLNPCRVVYSELGCGASATRAFAYGTLPGHSESGEERFSVFIHPETGDVYYEILAFSQPGSLLVRLGYPYARRLQARFAESSAAALGSASA